jgi:Tfp pilus assembly protein PilX
MKQTSSGQAVLITLLVLTIATTVALSLISRTTTDTTITTQTEESSQAFSAAEAGIEESLKSGSGSIGAQVLTPNVSSYTTLVSTIGNATGVYVFPKITQKGTTDTLWLVSHDSSGSLVETPTYTAPSIGICWSNETVIPALVATLLYKESTDNSYRVAKIGYDPSGARAAANKFTSSWTPGGCGGNTGTDYKQTLTFSSINPTIDPATDVLIALRIRPLYSDAIIAIDAGGMTLPQQGNKIESTGVTVGGTNRKIVVYQQYRAPSTVFDAAVYSQSSLEQ